MIEGEGNTDGLRKRVHKQEDRAVLDKKLKEEKISEAFRKRATEIQKDKGSSDSDVTDSELEPEPQANDPNESIKSTWQYQLLRTAVMLILFFIMHYFFNKYIMDPYIGTGKLADSRNEMKEKLMASICPDGVEGCEYNLRPDWEQVLDREL